MVRNRELCHICSRMALTSCLLFLSSPIFAGGTPGTRFVRFYAGDVFIAEIMPANSLFAPKIVNVPKYYDLPDFGSDTGYAVVVVKLDKGRSISSLDYVLSDGSAEYPCLAVSDADGVYDVSAWEKKKNDAGKKYSMLFKVRLPNSGKPQYRLKFKLRPTAVLEPNLRFVNVGDKPFTPLSKVPDAGMLGADPSIKKKASAVAENNAAPGNGAGKKKADSKAAKWNDMLKRKLRGQDRNEKPGKGAAGSDSGQPAAATGRAVKFKLFIPGKKGIINIAEIELFDSEGRNVARKAEVKASQIFRDCAPSRAIDGNKSGKLEDKGCFHSKPGIYEPWIALTFPPADIRKVVLWNRTDNKAQKRIIGTRLELADSSGKTIWSTEIKSVQDKYEFEIGR